jgi:hypothetical protein
MVDGKSIWKQTIKLPVLSARECLSRRVKHSSYCKCQIFGYTNPGEVSPVRAKQQSCL